MRFGTVEVWESRWRLPTLFAVFLLGWAGAFAAARWCGDLLGLVIVAGLVPLLGTLIAAMLCGARWLSCGLLLLGGLAALVSAHGTVGDRVLLSQGVTVEARVVSVGYGKYGKQQDCRAADVATGRPIPGTMRNCLYDGVDARITAVVDPEGGVSPYDGSLSDISEALGTDQTILLWGLAVQTFGVLLAATARLRRRLWLRMTTS